jgi:hypothetical protein
MHRVCVRGGNRTRARGIHSRSGDPFPGGVTHNQPLGKPRCIPTWGMRPLQTKLSRLRVWIKPGLALRLRCGSTTIAGRLAGGGRRELWNRAEKDLRRGRIVTMTKQADASVAGEG